nr:hypothetical protein [Tanacetum cinerariifolium]
MVVVDKPLDKWRMSKHLDTVLTDKKLQKVWMDKLLSNVVWDELIHNEEIEMVKNVVGTKDCYGIRDVTIVDKNDIILLMASIGSSLCLNTGTIIVKILILILRSYDFMILPRKNNPDPTWDLYMLKIL